MSLVAARVDPETRMVHMIADTNAYDSRGKYPNVKKITRRTLRTPSGHNAGDVLIWHVGEASTGFIARNMELPEVRKKADPQAVIDGIALAVQKFASEAPGDLSFGGGMDQLWVVGWNGHLWGFTHFDIHEDDVMGIGAGGDYARGSMRADALGVNVKESLYRAAEAARSCSHLVHDPWQYEIAEPL